MKIRNGFVSNSSSSSFLIYGTCASKENVIKGLKAAGVEVHDESYVKIEGLDVQSPFDDGGLYIGSSWSDVGDDETGAQFKARVEALIQKFLPDAKCSTHSEAWYDG